MYPLHVLLLVKSDVGIDSLSLVEAREFAVFLSSPLDALSDLDTTGLNGFINPASV